MIMLKHKITLVVLFMQEEQWHLPQVTGHYINLNLTLFTTKDVIWFIKVKKHIFMEKVQQILLEKTKL